MISQLEIPIAFPSPLSVIVSTVLFGLLFIISILLARRRKELGFKILSVATTLWFLSTLIPWVYPLFGGSILDGVGNYAPDLGAAAAIFALLMLMAHKSVEETHENKPKAEQDAPDRPL